MAPPPPPLDLAQRPAGSGASRPVPVTIELPAKREPDTLSFVASMEDVSAANRCSCSASDDNPY
ncbi:hypothetical protein [Micromonospora aurantiaca (nom. illeg.)]|uniref:hypothetical protein n=1 Tax=Micromonospora aurantiaca (nom. illeg.) TaxID=47850 RepID=UPI0033C891D5